MSIPTRHVLVLDDMGTPSVDQRLVTYSSFLVPSDNVKLIIISTPGAITQADKDACLEWAELDPYPTRNGYLEVLVWEMHNRHRIDAIFTHSEELVLRAAHLRQFLGIEPNGFHAAAGTVFRDKEVMKRTAKAGGFPVPEFQRILAPCDIVAFTLKHGYPVRVQVTR